MEQKSYTKKELRVLMEATGYPMASIEKTMRLLELYTMERKGLLPFPLAWCRHSSGT